MSDIATLNIRPPAVAGMFYPGDPAELSSTVERMLKQSSASSGYVKDHGDLIGSAPKALIVPHAGYVYSGTTAAAAYAALAPVRSSVRRVVLLGPTHRVAVEGMAIPASEAFATPLGRIPLDRAGMEKAARLPEVEINDKAHALEHSLEVHLPFLQTALESFTLVPIAVGMASPEAVADVLEALWGGPETLIIISSDLSHFLPYEDARRVDDLTCRHILHLEPHLTGRQACGAFPANGLLSLARQRGLVPALLARCNSGDHGGARDRVVGYAAIAFYETDEPQSILLNAARSAIASRFGDTDALPGQLERWPELQRPGASFVTLTQDGELRGCIGSLIAERPLLEDVQHNAIAAAFHDPRFEPLKASELQMTRIEVSVLTPPQPIIFEREEEAIAALRPGIDGVILSVGNHRATYLPQVWDQLPDPRSFLSSLKRKAGLPPDYWSRDVQLQRYSVRKWTECEP